MWWDITPLYFIAEILYTFKKRSLSKYKFGEDSRQQLKSDNLHFDGLLLSKWYEVSAKKSTEELPLMTLKSDAKFKEKLIFGFKYDMKKLVNFH